MSVSKLLRLKKCELVEFSDLVTSYLIEIANFQGQTKIKNFRLTVDSFIIFQILLLQYLGIA